jgi:hypothetical protein
MTQPAAHRTIEFVSLISGFDPRLESALTELSEQLESTSPSIPSFTVRRWDRDARDELMERLTDLLRIRSSGEPVIGLTNSRLFVLCDERHPFVAAAREENPRAHWGIAFPRRYAVAWVGNKYLWWHEALHLFNAKDCYNKFGINKCREPYCVMQASPTQHSCGGRLYLCSKNVRRIADDLSGCIIE